MSKTIESKVHAVSQRAHWLVLIHGLGCFLSVILAAGLLLGAADYLVRFRDPGVRLIWSTLWLLALAWSSWRFLWPALHNRFGDVEIAQRIERRFPQLSDRLSSSVEFLQAPREPGESLALRRAVIDETERAIKHLELSDCLDFQAIRGMIARAAPVLVMFGVVCLLDFDSTLRAARRLLVPWNQDAWPRVHQLEFIDTPHKIAAGADFDATLIDRNGRLPADVVIQYWYEGDSTHAIESRPMSRERDRATHVRENVTRSFKYRATGGDDDVMPWIALEVVDPVAIKELHVEVRSPAYSGIPPARSIHRPLRLLEGSQVHITGQVSRPIQKVIARIELTSPLSESATFEYPGVVQEDGRSFSISDISADLVGQGHYSLDLIESDGLVSGQETRSDWQVIADEPPRVTISNPPDQAYYTPQASVSLRAQAVDDLAVRTIQLQCARQTVSLFEATAPSRQVEFPVAAAETQQASYLWDLSLLSLQPGDKLEYQITASDFKPQSRETAVRAITIISTEDLESRLEKRNQSLRQLLGQALRLQRSTREHVKTVESPVAVGQLSKPDRLILQGAELQQSQVARLLGGEPDGARAVIAELSQAVHSNRIERPELTRQLADLSKQLQSVCEDALPEIQNGLREVLQMAIAGPGEMLPEEFAAIGARQQNVIQALEMMLQQLGALDDFRRFAREFSNVLRNQQKVMSDASRLATHGRLVEELSSPERTELKRLAQTQAELARRVDRLRGEMSTLQNSLVGLQPLPAATLKDAVNILDQYAVSESMRAAALSLQRNQLGNAATSFADSNVGLQAILDVLANRDAADAVRRVQQLEQVSDQLADLLRRQQQLQSDIEQHALQRGALAASDVGQRQSEIADASRFAARRLERLQAESAGQSANLAAQSAVDAGQAAAEGRADRALDAANTTAQRLEAAQRQLERQIEEAQNDRLRWQLTALKLRVAKLAEQQEMLNDVVRRLDQETALKQRQAMLPTVIARQSQVAADTTRTRDELEPSKAFSFGLDLAEQEMQRAVRRLRQGEIGELTQQTQAAALARLELLLKALEVDAPGATAGAQATEQTAADEAQDGNYSVVELRFLQSLQTNLQHRTVVVDQRRRSDDLDEGEGQRLLEELAAEQNQLSELTGEMVKDVRSQSRETIPAKSGIEAEPPEIPGTGLDQLLEGLQDPVPDAARRPPGEGEDLGSASEYDPLEDISQRMQAAGRRLMESDAGTQTQNLQQGIVNDLAALIDQLAAQTAMHQAESRPAAVPSNQAGNPPGSSGSGGSESPAELQGQELIESVWGQLPERLREQLQSPRADEFLPEYRTLIESYYRRLAEDQRQLRD